MQWITITNMARPYIQQVSWLMMGLVVLMALRVIWDMRRAAPGQRQPIALVAVALLASALLFTNKVWGCWNVLIIAGLSLVAVVLTTKPKSSSLISQAEPLPPGQPSSSPHMLWVRPVSLALVVGGLIGIASGYAPMFSVGPSMWPTAPKGMSLSWLNTTAYHRAPPTYGDDVDFEVTPGAANLSHATATRGEEWTPMSYRKRVWARGGDHLVITGSKVTLNDQLIADCSDKTRVIAPRIWWCTVHWPNGASRDVVWGWDNELYYNHIDEHVPAGQLFMIGDNTVESSDSRDRGPIQEQWVQGRFDHDTPVITPWQAWEG